MADEQTTLDDGTATEVTDTETTTADTTSTEPADDAKSTGDDGTDWKAMARKHEQRAKDNAAAAKELAKLKQAQMSEAEKLAADRDAAKAEADQIKAELARERAARKHSLTDDDLALLDGVPADQFEARAAALAKRLGAATKAPAGRSGNEVGGAKPEPSIDQQIADAQKAGNLPLVIALKQRKHHAA